VSPDLPAIGLVEDDAVMAESLLQRLELEGFQASHAASGSEALQRFADRRLDLVVCDIRLPDMNGEELFRCLQGSAPGLPVLFITGHGEIEQAIRLIRAGAADYLTKPFEMPEFLARVRELVRSGSEQQTPPVLGQSRSMRELEDLLRRVAPLDSTLLLTGETGTGKDVAARFVHGLAGRPEAPFMAVNCAAIPGELLESELFGHERGAFTGASQRHLGYAERAGEGILFLDEIGDLPPPVQAKLLRLLEERYFYRVGGERPVDFKARVVCATNADLGLLVESGDFRKDLYFRIAVISAALPPLRERPDDVVPLLERFVQEFAALLGREVSGVTPDAEEAALDYAWPGNIRELRNRVERAVALAVTSHVRAADLFPELRGRGQVGEDRLATLAEVRDAAERRQIQRALERTDGQVAKAAGLLGISRTTLWEKARRLGLGL
jgi:DNA-binding NtrC family response regulator